MKIKTSELEGAALDWAVGIAINGKPIMTEIYGVHILGRSIQREVEEGRMKPSTDWSQAGPLIKKYLITIGPQAVDSGLATDTYWFAMRAIWGIFASSEKEWGPRFYSKKGPLIAAMRAIVAAEIGNEVDVPEELAGGAR